MLWRIFLLFFQSFKWLGLSLVDLLGFTRVNPHIANIDDHAVHPLPLELLAQYFTKRETTLSPAKSLDYLLQVTWQWVCQVLVLFLSLEDLFKKVFGGLPSHH